MAGDWIKIEHATPDKPEIVKMAAVLGIDQDAVFGKAVRLWIWADQQSVDGNALSVTDSFIDRLAYCPGFAAALRKVGWLVGRDGLLSIPNFCRHNGKSAKTRALTKDRVAKSRDCNAESVTEALPEQELEREKNKSAAARPPAAEVDFSELDFAEVAHHANKLASAVRGTIDREFIWRACVVAELLDRGLIGEMVTRIKAGEVRKPKSYIEKVLREECEARAIDWRAARDGAPAPPPPAKAALTA